MEKALKPFQVKNIGGVRLYKCLVCEELMSRDDSRDHADVVCQAATQAMPKTFAAVAGQA